MLCRQVGRMKFVNYAVRNLAIASILAPSYAFSPITPIAQQFSSTAMRASKMDQSFPTWSFDKPCGSMDWSQLVSTTLTTAESQGESDLILVGVYAPPVADGDEKADVPIELSGAAKDIDEALGGALKELMEENAKTFKGGAKTGGMTPTLRLAVPGEKSKRYVVVGLGKKDDKKGVDAASLGKAIAAKCNDEAKVTSCAVILPDGLNSAKLTDFSTAVYSSLYSDNRYRTGDKVKKLVEDLTDVKLVTSALPDDAADAIQAGKDMATGIFLTKDIVNAPHNVLNSQSLADTAKRIAAESNGRIKCTILNKKECEARGMGAYLGVARGSETEPQFIHLTYTPKTGKDNKKIGVVGKGLLFDTGGYNIKTAMMELMKFDCGGSAAVLGAARAVGALQPEGVEAHFIVAACENMINEKAVVPSDVLTASNGMTIEIINTDAEGRLTLADALVYADKELGCESIIELSTLTGACMVSLGKEVAGVFTDNEDLASELKDISEVTGDKSWRMPLEKSYNEQLESKIADIKNCGTRYGGAITAGLFLQNFVDKKKPFAHIDIAGPVWSDKDCATGYGAKLVTEWVSRQGKKE
eukprot:CAMPEP_0202447576 /NCGR_PEP_ID=MMETSP1360-20130828/6333_1 /ASSEMBLY_ACC=CAM_ASM_000848 /TAXON_ID=515479 /ORGANISM="Licmophora paradoxa, Strain CCMP2313" /LENGTH=585 /DNA_ID=CAMNT_0049064733 /DNA_START=52 /DNA_END=1809 /DNA_ORIENTATION=+